MTKSRRAHLQEAYNALCSAEDSLDKADVGSGIRGRLAEIRAELGRTAFPSMTGGSKSHD